MSGEQIYRRYVVRGLRVDPDSNRSCSWGPRDAVCIHPHVLQQQQIMRSKQDYAGLPELVFGQSEDSKRYDSAGASRWHMIEPRRVMEERCVECDMAPTEQASSESYLIIHWAVIGH